MLSPGVYYQSVPREPYANLQWRLKLLERCSANPRYRAAVVEMCRTDILFYINCFVYQYNPFLIGNEVGPFITWDFQDDAFRTMLSAVEDQRDLVIEKSREMGASWMCLILMDWIAKFQPNKQLGMISRDADAVESPSPDSLMWKLDFMSEKQPEWLTGEITRRKMNRKYLRSKSQVAAEASTGKAFVGGRAMMIFADEFSQFREGYDFLHRTADSSRCRIFNFTHTGASGAAFDLSERTDIRKLRMHWSQHPRKRPGLYRFDVEKQHVVNLDRGYEHGADYPHVLDGSPSGGPYPGLRSPWYDAECLRRGSARAIAMDLDIDPKGSSSQVFDQLLIRKLQRQASEPFFEGDFLYDHRTGAPQEFSRRDGGDFKLWCSLDINGKPPFRYYGAGADISQGTGATNSTFSIVDGVTGEKVLEYASPNISPERFGVLAVGLCKFFANLSGEGAKLAWENHGPGVAFGKMVWDGLGYRHVYYKTNETGLWKRVQSDQPGWNPSGSSKLLLLRDYMEALVSGRCTNRSKEALEECLSFEYDQSGNMVNAKERNIEDPSGARENHGDRVIADALAWKMVSQGVKEQLKEKPDARPDPNSFSMRWLHRGKEPELHEEAWYDPTW